MSLRPSRAVKESLIGDRKINQDRCAVVEGEGAVLLAIGRWDGRSSTRRNGSTDSHRYLP